MSQVSASLLFTLGQGILHPASNSKIIHTVYPYKFPYSFSTVDISFAYTILFMCTLYSNTRIQKSSLGSGEFNCPGCYCTISVYGSSCTLIPGTLYLASSLLICSLFLCIYGVSVPKTEWDAKK